MEKKIWTKPEVGEVVFPANAYCNTCTTTFSNVSGTGNLYVETTNDDSLNIFTLEGPEWNINHTEVESSSYIDTVISGYKQNYPEFDAHLLQLGDDNRYHEDFVLNCNEETSGFHTHNTGLSNATNTYNGYFVTSSGTSKVKIWWEEITGYISGIHAAFVNATPS